MERKTARLAIMNYGIWQARFYIAVRTDIGPSKKISCGGTLTD